MVSVNHRALPPRGTRMSTAVNRTAAAIGCLAVFVACATAEAAPTDNVVCVVSGTMPVTPSTIWGPGVGNYVFISFAGSCALSDNGDATETEVVPVTLTTSGTYNFASCD